METQCQHLTMTQRNEFLKLFQNFKELFNGTLVTYKTDTLDFGFKEDVKPMCLLPYPVPEVHEQIFKKKVE